MYCIKCGVELADSEKVCPLCKTEVFHPHLTREPGEKLYPEGKLPGAKKRSWLPQILLSILYLTPVLVVLLCDWQAGNGITWSGYVVGALTVIYAGLVLPLWFRNPNPVIFVPCWFAVVGAYVFYISYVVQGQWFLTFALPLIGALCLVTTAVVTLMRYVKRGALFIFGGASVLLGLLCPVIELLAGITFPQIQYSGWSYFPMIPLFLLGGFLIFLGIYAPAREAMERKLFL